MQKLLRLIERSGLSDSDLAAVFGVQQSTVSRLKNGKIQKIQWYIHILEDRLGGASSPDEELLADLIAFSKHSPEVRKILLSLHALIREGQ